MKKLNQLKRYENNLFIHILVKNHEAEIIQKLISKAITNGSISELHIYNK
jgi:hypothetical protein